MRPEYKAEKTASVTDLQGGGIWEINILTFLAPAAAFVWTVLQTRQAYFKPYTFPAYLVDFLLQCCTILCTTTVYADSPQTLAGLLLLPAVATYLQPKGDAVDTSAPMGMVEKDGKLVPVEQVAEVEEEKDPLPVKPFITSYRGAMMIVTCTSILAVDFQVFPRRFGKTEAFGTSLMDLGVGSFVFAAGLVAARQQLKEDLANVQRSLVRRMKTALRHALPLFVLGMIRLYTVKNLDYSEHVSEYGVHWNFFFTLALLGPTFAILQPLIRVLPAPGIFAFMIAIGYEIWLYMTPLKKYIILSERIPGDWLSQNREGVYSFTGYFAIFLAGMSIGQGILPRDQKPADDPVQAAKDAKDALDEDADWLSSVLDPSEQPEEGAEGSAELKPKPDEKMKIEFPQIALVHLVKWSFLWFVFSVWALWRYGPRLSVSRRMANLAYVCWVCAFNCTQLSLFCWIEMIMFPGLYLSRNNVIEKQKIRDATSRVLHAFNRNGLALFLMANMLTGAINLKVETWNLGDVESMAVLVGYIGTICVTGLVLDHYDISIKL